MAKFKLEAYDNLVLGKIRSSAGPWSNAFPDDLEALRAALEEEHAKNKVVNCGDWLLDHFDAAETNVQETNAFYERLKEELEVLKGIELWAVRLRRVSAKVVFDHKTRNKWQVSYSLYGYGANYSNVVYHGLAWKVFLRINGEPLRHHVYAAEGWRIKEQYRTHAKGIAYKRAISRLKDDEIYFVASDLCEAEPGKPEGATRSPLNDPITLFGWLIGRYVDRAGADTSLGIKRRKMAAQLDTVQQNLQRELRKKLAEEGRVKL